eukprot:11858763-Ditylum_brightwellii.AAC.1
MPMLPSSQSLGTEAAFALRWRCIALILSHVVIPVCFGTFFTRKCSMTAVLDAAIVSDASSAGDAAVAAVCPPD